jgi:hypothetical protein
MNLSSYYLSPKRALEIVDQKSLQVRLKQAQTFQEIGGDHLGRMMVLNVLEEALLSWMVSAKPPTLGELILQGHATIGKIFTHRTDFNCKGVTQAAFQVAQGRPLQLLPYLYSKLDAYQEGLKVKLDIHPSDLTTSSSAGFLSGRKNLFMLGRIASLEPKTIIAKPYTIGSIYFDAERQPANSEEWPRWDRSMQVFMEEIDSFAKTRLKRNNSSKDFAILKHIPEKTIKAAFADIIGEPFVPKDWGGEQSDLLTAHIRLDGKRVQTAFIFKGPAKYKPLTLADIGKNGDQIVRAFGEPADLIILQHCHQITSSVIATMRAFAGRIGNLKQFCTIDGADTVRLLRAYIKLPRKALG